MTGTWIMILGEVVTLLGCYFVYRRKTIAEYQRGFREGMSFGLKQKMAVKKPEIKVPEMKKPEMKTAEESQGKG